MTPNDHEDQAPKCHREGQDGHVARRMMAGDDLPDAVSPADCEQRESQRVDEIPDDKLTVRHLRRTRYEGGGEEDGQTSPPSVGPLPVREELFAVGLMFSGTFDQISSPPQPDPVAGDASDFSGERDDDHGSYKAQLSVAGGYAGCSGRHCADERHSGPRSGDTHEHQEVE